MAENVHTVVVTGFGPFGNHSINASWEIVKELAKLNLKNYGIDLIIQEIPVSYSCVEREVPLLWKEHNPELVIHMGVSSLAREMILETKANKSGYCKPDVDGRCPDDGCCNGIQEVIETKLKLEDVCKRVKLVPGIVVNPCISSDAGRYVCEFTYYTSLNINDAQTVFVHVPEINKPYSIQEMANCAKHIILCLLEQTRYSSTIIRSKENVSDKSNYINQNIQTDFQVSSRFSALSREQSLDLEENEVMPRKLEKNARKKIIENLNHKKSGKYLHKSSTDSEMQSSVNVTSSSLSENMSNGKSYERHPHSSHKIPQNTVTKSEWSNFINLDKENDTNDQSEERN